MNPARSSAIRFIVALAILAGCATAVAWNQKTIARLRAEQEILLRDSQEAQRLARENSGIEQLRASASAAEQLRAETAALPSLRNEVTQLRKGANELDSLRAEHDRLAAQNKSLPKPSGFAGVAPTPPGFIAKAALGNAGLATPEAALQTHFWAMREGNLDQLTLSEINGKWNRNGNREYELRQLADRMNYFTGYAIVGRKDVAPDQVILVLQGSVNGSSRSVRLNREGTDWKLNDY